MQCACTILSSGACPTLQYVSILLHKRHDFRKKKLLTVKCRFDFLYNYCLKHFSFLISSFRCVLYVVCFHLGNSPASGVYIPMFRNTLSHLHRPMKMEQTECSETSAYKLQTLGNYPKESIQHFLF